MPNLNELDPDSEEFEAAVIAAQDAEDEANGNTEAASDDEAPKGEAQAAVAEGEPAEPAAEAASEPEQQDEGAQGADTGPIAGVLSADGKRVLPYVALKAERRAASHERKLRETAERERDEARRLIEELKAGKQPEADPDALSDEDLEDLKLVGPAGEKVVARLKAAEEALAKATPAKTAEPEPEDPQQVARERTQEDIDSIPLLLEWQAGDPEKFSRAVELDNVLKTSRKWADKPQAERFAHVTALVADEFDIAFEAPPRTTTPKPTQADPKTVLKQAARTAPSTLSDLKGGAIDQGDVRIDKMPPAQATARMSKMTDAEIEKHLARFG